MQDLFTVIPFTSNGKDYLIRIISVDGIHVQMRAFEKATKKPADNYTFYTSTMQMYDFKQLTGLDLLREVSNMLREFVDKNNK